jgi:hypothetical protein
MYDVCGLAEYKGHTIPTLFILGHGPFFQRIAKKLETRLAPILGFESRLNFSWSCVDDSAMDRCTVAGFPSEDVLKWNVAKRNQTLLEQIDKSDQTKAQGDKDLQVAQSNTSEPSKLGGAQAHEGQGQSDTPNKEKKKFKKPYYTSWRKRKA